MKIITNNHWNQFLYGYELPEEIKKDFDYMDSEELETSNFIHYRNRYYTTGDFMRIENHPDNEFSNYDGYHSDSYFSGVLIKLSDCGEAYKIATYIS